MTRWSRLVGVMGIIAGAMVVGLTGQPSAVVASSAITGTVFQDFDSDGVMDTAVAIGVAFDVGVAGIEVRGFDSTGAQVGSTTTGAGGGYTLNIAGAATTSVRVEFTIPSTNASLAGFTSSFATTTGASGSQYGSAIQFATIGNTGVNFAVNRPGDYCQNNPTLVTCAAEAGTGSTTNVGAFTLSTAISGFTDFNENSTRIGSSRSLGAVFGIGTDRNRNSYYGTYVKRHVEYGSAGAVNAIYRINHDNPGTVTTFVTLPGTLPAHNSTAVGSFGAYSGDTTVFDQVGRVGLGDVDVTDDGTTLLAVDMNEAAPKLWFVPISGSGNGVTAGAASSITIPTPVASGGVSCPGKWHPMGIGTRGNRILVGGVCGAENTVSPATPRGPDPTQSTAFIMEYSGTRTGVGSFQTIWAAPLSYERSCVYREGTRIPCDPATSTVETVSTADWAAWNGHPNLDDIDGPTGGLFASNPQAMLANIEITDSGDLIVGLRDRFQDQIMTGQAAYSLAYADTAYPQPPLPFPKGLGTMAGGDLLRVCASGSTYTTEANGTCANLAGAAQIEPRLGLREYYYDPYDNGFNDTWGPAHPETAQGATATMPGYPGVWATVYDVRTPGEQGVLSFGSCSAASAGTTCRGPATGYGSQNGGYGFGNLNNFNKGIGLTDIEVLCDMAPVQIGDRVWMDTDGDGVQDPGEAPIAGVTVRLYDAAGNLVSTARTNAKGEYLFSSTILEAASGGASPDALGGNVVVGSAYTIRFDNPADYTASGPLNGYTVTSRDATTTTATDSEDAIDSDAQVTSLFPRTTVPALMAGGNNHTYDVGFVPVVAVGNYTWVDSDSDGMQDVGEPPLAGVKVELFDANGNPAVDANGLLVAAQTTDANGKYLFDNLAPGNYRIKFTSPSGYAGTTADAAAATQATDSDADAVTGMTAVFTVASTVSGDTVADSDPATIARLVNTTIDAGFVPEVSVGSKVWLDSNRDGVQDAGEAGIPNVTLNITTADGSPVTDVFGNPVTTTTTDANGNYQFENLPAGQYKVSVVDPTGYVPTVTDKGTTATDSSTGSATSIELTTNGASDTTLDFGFVPPMVSVGNLVWVDTNRDGVQDAGEPGIPNVTLTISKADGSAVTDVFGNPVTTTTTDANGNYVFENLPVGQYKVSVTDPVGYIPTVTGKATASTDSSTGLATSSELTTNGASDTTLDFGFVAPRVSVGDFVWFDLDNDGTQERGEPPLGGVVLSITTADSGPVTDVFGNEVTSTITDADGRYSFDDLPVGQYTVTVVPPAGFEATRANRGDGGTDSSTGTATSKMLTIEGSRDASLDFGFWAPPAVVGSRVWNDLDRDGLQDVDEPGVGGVNVALSLDDGSPVRDLDGFLVPPTVTDRLGNYLFSNLPLGETYEVTITYPDGAEPTLRNQGPDRDNDSSTGKATSVLMTPTKRVDLSLDFGVVLDDVTASAAPKTVDVSTPIAVNQRRLVGAGQAGWLNPFIMADASKGANWDTTSTRLWNKKTKSWTTNVTTKEGSWEVIRGQVKFTPAEDFRGVAKLAFAITDTAGKTAIAELYVGVDAELPRTGADPHRELWLGIVLSLLGVVCLRFPRRRHS